MTAENKTAVRDLSAADLTRELAALGEKPFRARQLYDWLWKRQARSFDEMSNLSKSLREKLKTRFTLNAVEIVSEQKSGDGSVKFGLRLHDGNLVEGVLIPAGDRMTACVSSQAGCSLNCKFCATGYLPLKRNLHHYEIFDQVAIISEAARKYYGQPLSNIVYMGMGEPLLNYKHMMRSIERITAPDAMGMSPRRITVSTAGVAKLIKRLGDDQARFEFALSLHAADDEKRNEIMPINESNSLEALSDALKHFYNKTKNRVTLEYIVFHDFNDSLEDAAKLLKFSRVAPAKINIIEYNPIAEALFQNASEERFQKFIAYLEKKGAIVNVRRSRGKDVDGACGQLALKNQPKELLASS